MQANLDKDQMKFWWYSVRLLHTLY